MRAAILLGATLFGATGCLPAGGASRAEAGTDRRFECAAAAAVDGRTLQCGNGQHIRLAGIAAPAAGSAEAARSALRQLVSGRPLMCEGAGEAGTMVVAFCRRGDGLDLGCAMVASGAARRIERDWEAHRCASHPDMGRERTMGEP